MPISSVSKTFVAPDPVMETDLELLGKVNTYQQSKFDAGAAALQQEVDNWALMTQIAKPELRQYANAKLVNLVNGINSMGGVNLSDINNVNALKAQGYNIYGDQTIMDGIETTMKMKALQQDAKTKLSGKDGAKYDNTVASYLMKGYSDWANDGDVSNTRYDGPVELPMGNMNTINEKVRAYLKELKPDSDSAPSGDLQQSYGYFQFEGKWLKGDRIREAIDATTDENDALIFRAHGWSALGSDTDQQLQQKMGIVYDNAASAIKQQINDLQTRLNNTSDASMKLELQNLIAQQKQALANNDQEKNAFISKKSLSKQEREGIQESLYRNAWRSNVENSYAYRQQKTEYKANMPLIFHDRMQIQAQQWAKDYDLRVKEYELRKMKTEAEIDNMTAKNTFGNNPNLPWQQVTLNNENNQQESPEKMIDQFNTEYFQANYAYYSQLYNLLGAHDTKGRFENKNGQWTPKAEYAGHIDKEMQDLMTKMDNYSNLSEGERAELNKLLPTDPAELQALFTFKSKVNSLKAFSKIAHDKETEVINTAIAQGKLDFDWRGIKVRVNDGRTIKDMPIEDVLALGTITSPTGDKIGVYGDDVQITAIPGVKYPQGFPSIVPNDLTGVKAWGVSGGTGGAAAYERQATPEDYRISKLKDLKKYVSGLRDDLSRTYKKAGGQVFNSYSVPIPFNTLSKGNQEVIQKQLAGVVDASADIESINPIDGRIEYDFNSNKPVYKVRVQYKKGSKLQPVQEIDVSNLVVNGGGGFGIQSAFPTSNIAHAWGLTLAKDGSTPFTQSDNYSNSLRTTRDNYPFQVSTIPNSLNGTVGTKVKIALPVGGGKTVEVNVKNFETGSMLFPPDVDMIQRYLDVVLGTPEKKAQFYKLHGLQQPK